MAQANLKDIIKSPEGQNTLVDLFIQHGRAYHCNSKLIPPKEIPSPWAPAFLETGLMTQNNQNFQFTDLGKTIAYGLLEVKNSTNRFDPKEAQAIDIPLSPVSLFKGKHVIDIGCGSGSYTTHASKAGAKTAIGIDIQLPLLQTAQALHHDINTLFTVGTSAHLPIASHSTDLIILRGILAYVDNHELFREIARISKPNCQIFITTQGIGYFLTALKNAFINVQPLQIFYTLLVISSGLSFTMFDRRFPVYVKKYFTKELIAIFHTKIALTRTLKKYGFHISSMNTTTTNGFTSNFSIVAIRQ